MISGCGGIGEESFDLSISQYLCLPSTILLNNSSIISKHCLRRNRILLLVKLSKIEPQG